MAFGKGDIGQFIIERAVELRLQPVADGEARGRAIVGIDNRKRMIGPGDHGVTAIELEGEGALIAFAFAGHGNGAERGAFDLYRQLFDRGDEDMAAIRFAAEHGGEEADHRRAGDPAALMIPTAVAGDAHFAVAAMIGIPSIDRGMAAFTDQSGKLFERLAGEREGLAGFGHPRAIGKAAASCQHLPMRAWERAMQRTAIVTGARHRVGRAISEALLADGWRVLAHVRAEGDDVADGAIKVVADLAAPDCAEHIFSRSSGPVDLLVNNAARFAADSLEAPDAAEFDAHMAVNLRAPTLLTAAFARQFAGEDGLIVNITDAKLAAPNPDFLSYTLAKQGLAGLTEIAAKAFAIRRIRVNAIAPALMLVSEGQDEDGFARVHGLNPLGRGVEVADLVAALRYLIEARTVTGQTLLLDSGQRFMGLPRDVQYLEGE